MDGNLALAIEEVIRDEEFQKKAEKTKNTEEVRNLFKEFGVELSIEETESVVQEITKITEDYMSENELSEETLDKVAGGLVLTFTGGCIFALGCALFGAGEIGLAAWLAKQKKNSRQAKAKKTKRV